MRVDGKKSNPEAEIGIAWNILKVCVESRLRASPWILILTWIEWCPSIRSRYGPPGGSWMSAVGAPYALGIRSRHRGYQNYAFRMSGEDELYVLD